MTKLDPFFGVDRLDDVTGTMPEAQTDDFSSCGGGEGEDEDARWFERFLAMGEFCRTTS